MHEESRELVIEASARPRRRSHRWRKMRSPLPPLRWKTALGVATAAAMVMGCSGDQADDILVYGRGSDSIGLDPSLETDGESFKVCDNIYETLVTYEEESTVVRPLLAKSWDVSVDQLV